MKYYIIIFLFCLSCNKQDAWLDKKSNLSDIVPVSIADFQATLDNDGVMNANYPALGLLGSDNYYITFAQWQGRQAIERNAYVWNPEVYENSFCPDWSNPYKMVEYANIALDGIARITPAPSEQAAWDLVKGSALFYRAYAFYQLAQVFSKPYNKTTAATDPGIPIRMSSDVNERSVRATVEETYKRITEDILTAKDLLPTTPALKTRASKKSVLALLARVSLATGDILNAEKYATEAITMQPDLIDLNTLNQAAAFPFPTFQSDNKEVIFYAITLAYGTLSNSSLRVDTFLYRSYAANDLRKSILYKDNGINGIAFRGDYTGLGLSSKFGGLAVNEMYLIRAEALARQNKVAEAIADLNALLVKRWKTGTYIALTAISAADALQKIISERRKELPFTGNLPWEDLRRLNNEPQFERALHRLLNGQSYTLPPRDKKYVYPIPESEIILSGLEQNPR